MDPTSPEFILKFSSSDTPCPAPPIFNMLYSLAISISLLISITIAPVNAITTLADGKSMEYGQLSNGLTWQSSGVLTQGCFDRVRGSIQDCYELELTSNPKMQLDPGTYNSPRQRIEFLTAKQTPGRLYTYQWKQFLSSSNGPSGLTTSSQFFHLMQIFDSDPNVKAPIVTLTARNGRVEIEDLVRPNCGKGCPSVPIKSYAGKTTIHRLKLVSGPSGTMSYTVTDAATGKNLISYDAKGKFGSDATYLKFGTYRATYQGMSTIDAAVGDFSRPN